MCRAHPAAPSAFGVPPANSRQLDEPARCPACAPVCALAELQGRKLPHSFLLSIHCAQTLFSACIRPLLHLSVSCFFRAPALCYLSRSSPHPPASWPAHPPARAEPVVVSWSSCAAPCLGEPCAAPAHSANAFGPLLRQPPSPSSPSPTSAYTHLHPHPTPPNPPTATKTRPRASAMPYASIPTIDTHAFLTPPVPSILQQGSCLQLPQLQIGRAHV